MQRNRAYFFDTPRTTAGAKLNAQNIPSETTFRDLLDSIPFKNETGDYATETVQGLVKLASVAISLARSGTGVVLPAHLTSLEVNGTELLSSNASYQGIKVTAISATNRLNYQVDLDPVSIVEKTTPDSADYVLISDSGASFIPKKVRVSNFSNSSYWQKNTTVLSPVTAGDSLDMSGGSVTADNLYLSSSYPTARKLTPKAPTENAGTDFSVSAGSGGSAGSFSRAGGTLYLNGGLGVFGGANGKSILCYDGTSVIGTAAIGGATVPGYMLTVWGNARVAGTLNFGTGITPTPTPGPGTGGGTAILDSSTGALGFYSNKATLDQLLGATLSNKSVLWFNGTAYTSLALGGSADKYLRVNSSLNLEAGDLVLTGKVYNASLAEAILWASMTALNNNMVPVTNGSGVLTSSAVSATELGYLSGVTSAIQTQISAITGNVVSWTKILTTTILTASTLKATHTCDSTGGAISLTLPLISTLQQGQVVEINNISANGTTVYSDAGDSGFVTKAGASSVDIAIGDQACIRLIVDGTTWRQLR